MAELSLRTIDTNLSFQKTKENFSFFHRENLLFYQNKEESVYFVQAMITDNLSVPLDNIYVNIEKDGRFFIECKHEEYEVFLYVREIKEDTVSFVVENPHRYKGVVLSFARNFYDRVLNMNAYRPPVLKKDNKANQAFFREQKLSFCLENKFFFENESICSGSLGIQKEKSVDVFIMQSQGRFSLHMGKDLLHVKHEKQSSALTYFTERKVFAMQEALTGKKFSMRLDGIICDPEVAKKENLKRSFPTVICRLPLVYQEKNMYSDCFEKGCLLLTNGVYKMDFSKEDTLIGFKNVVRKIFDIRNADGVYLDLQDYGGAEIVFIKEAIQEIRTEYESILPKVVLYDKVSPLNDFDGYYIIGDPRKTIVYSDYTEYYQFIGEFYLGAIVYREEDVQKVGHACQLVIIGK